MRMVAGCLILNESETKTALNAIETVGNLSKAVAEDKSRSDTDRERSKSAYDLCCGFMSDYRKAKDNAK